MKRLFLILCLVAFSVSAFAKDIEIGYVMAGPDIYYRTSADVFTKLAKKAGYRVTTTSSAYSPSKEVANVEDFIAKGVDLIILVTANAEVATKNAQRAKDAGIPIFMVSALPSKAGFHIPTGMVVGNWGIMGAGSGKYIGMLWKNPRIAMIEGAYGQGIAESIRKGFVEAIKAEGSNPEIVWQATGGWMRKGGLETAQDIIASQKEYDVLYIQNEEMAAGALQAFKEAGQEGKPVFSNNGKEMAWNWLKKGVLTGTVANAPTGEGDLVFQMVDAFLKGKKFPRAVYMEMSLLTKDNLNGAIPWDINDYFDKKAKGELVMDLYSMKTFDSM